MWRRKPFLSKICSCVHAGTLLASPHSPSKSPACFASEREQIQQELDALAVDQPEAVKAGFTEALLRGVASHHAGCLPAWKSLVERLFQRGEGAAQLRRRAAKLEGAQTSAIIMR
jgi:hypothetical protein